MALEACVYQQAVGLLVADDAFDQRVPACVIVGRRDQPCEEEPGEVDIGAARLLVTRELALVSRDLADEFGFSDVDGRLPNGPMHRRPKGIGD